MASLSWPPHCTNWRPRRQTDTDASDIRTGAVLSQVQDGEERVISYASKSLEGTKQRYCTARMELLEVVRALKHFKCYLYGQKITVRTDNCAVSWLYRSKDPVGQPARWIEVIDTYNVTFQHRPGRKHGNADALSQYPCHQCGGKYNGTQSKGVKVVTRSRVYEPGWGPEDLSTDQGADTDMAHHAIMRSGSGTPVPGGRTSCLGTRRYYGVNGNDFFWYLEYYTDSSTN